MTEIWETTEGFNQLEISNLGNVRTPAGKQPEPFVNKTGYVAIKLATRCYVNIHSLVAAAFLTKTDPKQVITHIDGNRLNNAADNLKYVSRAEVQRGAWSRREKSVRGWKDIPGFEGRYQVSPRGKVRSLKRTVTLPDGTHRHIKASEKPIKKCDRGYATVLVGKKICLRVHTLVAAAFMTPEPGKILVHLNGNNMDNRVKNLKYMTRTEAHEHKNPPRKLFRRRKRRTSTAQEGASA